MASGTLIADLAVVTVVAAVTGMAARRLGQPGVLGYLLAGLIVGPYIPIPLFADPHRMEELAEVGVVLVMFAVGLEFRIQRLLQILPVSGLTAAVQIAALMWAGFTVGELLGWSTPAAITLGATLAISSTMVVSAVFRSRPVDPDVRSHVLGILVVQDVVAILLMTVVTALAAGQSVGPGALGLLVAQLAAVVVAMLVGGLLILPRLVRWAQAQADTEVLVVLVAGAAFGFALLAGSFGYSVALGAFIAGMVVAESGRGTEVEHAIEPLRALFSAIFFVSIGMSVDPVVAWSSLPLAALLCAVVISMQFLSVTVASVLSGSSLRKSVHSGLALGQIGELSFILATVAIAGQIAPAELMPALVTVATVTAFTTPLLLGRAEQVVTAIDGGLPHRVTDLLTAYQSFSRRARTPSGGTSLSKPATAVALDWLALLVLFVARFTVALHVDPGMVWMVNLAALVLAVPFLVGLLRSGRRLAAAVRAIARQGSTATPVSRVIESLVLLAVVLAIGTPAVAVARPLLDGSWGEAVLVFSLLSTLVWLALRAGGLGGEYTSGVARVAMGIARHVGVDQDVATTPHVATGPIAGLDYVPVPIPRGAPAEGATLADLNLRCRTGATVVAIFRGDDTTVLPTGQERLGAQDVLAISGSEDAVQRARVLLLEGQPALAASVA